MAIGNRLLRLGLTVAAAAAILVPLVSAQFDGGRRRADSAPISLPGGSTVEFASFDSAAIGMPARYSIFLPPSYSKDRSRTYPVIYFLHGLNNDETSWTVDRYGRVQNRLEELMLSGKVPEFLMVHPRGDNSFYCNYIDGSKRYEDLIAEEFIAEMEKRHRAKKGRANRSIAGTSMGGYGALKIAMKYPERYAAVAAQSPILFPGNTPPEMPEDPNVSRFYSFFLNMVKPIFGNPVREDLWQANNPLALARRGGLAGLGIYFDYGTDDRYIPMVHLDEGCKALDRILAEEKVPHTFKVHPGEPHGWALIEAHLEETLPFLCRTFEK